MNASAIKLRILLRSGGLLAVEGAVVLFNPNNLFPTTSANSGGALSSSQMNRNLVASVLMMLLLVECDCSDKLSHSLSISKSTGPEDPRRDDGRDPFDEATEPSSSCFIWRRRSLKIDRNKLNGILESPSLLMYRVTITRFFIFFTMALTVSVACTINELLPVPEGAETNRNFEVTLFNAISFATCMLCLISLARPTNFFFACPHLLPCWSDDIFMG
mmetsp:Transcript_13093/g.19597  ORF Transcript_13093/g.19597 Transcript_13093/m.19597 type:complete len:217 (+) Transcript_13093:2332-2982(+)